MRFPLFVTSLVVCTPLLISSEAAAISCWVCDHGLDTCIYYRQTGREDCLSGCDSNYTSGSPSWNMCRNYCQSDYANGLAECQANYDYCSDGCVHPPIDNCPIVLDLGRHGWKFTSAQMGVLFDINGDGHRDPIAWTDPEAEDGFLVWDRNLNGIIDSGLELFGDSTVQPPSNTPNGFLALAVLDQVNYGGNGDGMISNQDELWNALQIWVDRNHNGRSESSELASLGSYGVVGIDLAFHESRRTDQYGNALRYRSRVWLEDGTATHAVDVFFQRLP